LHKPAQTQEDTPVAELAAQNPVEVPRYTPLDVARYLRAPVWLVISMWRGRFLPHPEMFFRWFDRWLRQFDIDGYVSDVPELQERWSFRQLADLYVRYFAVESLRELVRNELRDRGRGEVISEAAWRILRDRPGLVFFGEVGHEEGVANTLSSCGDRLNDGERRWLEKRLLLCLGRFDLDGGTPCRLYPFSRVPPDKESPRTVVMDPTIRFGRPTVATHGTPTDILFERHQAGDSIAELADDYGIAAAEVEEAIRYDAKPPSLWFPFIGW
jgi:uncharacterized protein (DUF433 family)